MQARVAIAAHPLRWMGRILVLLGILSAAREAAGSRRTAHSLAASPLSDSAVIVLTGAQPGVDIYVFEGEFLQSLGAVVDSARASGPKATLTFVPTPEKRYSIWVAGGAEYTPLFLTPGDSLCLQLDSASSRFTIVRDRLGANQAYIQALSGLPPGVDLLVDDTTCRLSATFDSICRLQMVYLGKQAELCRSKFPEHLAVAESVRMLQKQWYNLQKSYAVWYRQRYVKSGCVVDSASWIWTANIPYDSTSNQWELYNFCKRVLETRAARYGQNDTSGGDEFRLRYQMDQALTSWHGLERDVALLELVDKADQNAPLSLALDLTEHALNQTIVAGGDLRIIRLIKARLQAMQERIPGVLQIDIALPDSGGHVVSLSRLHGKALFLHFWGTWCGACLSDWDALRTFITQRSRDTNLVIVNIAYESQGSFEHWKRFIKQHPLGGVQLFAEWARHEDRAHPYGFQWVQWIPAYIVVDRFGHLVSADEYPPPNIRLERDILRAEQE